VLESFYGAFSPLQITEVKEIIVFSDGIFNTESNMTCSMNNDLISTRLLSSVVYNLLASINEILIGNMVKNIQYIFSNVVQIMDNYVDVG